MMILPADAESVIEESPLAQSRSEPEAEPVAELVEDDPDADTSAQPTAQDPAWVQQMFAEAEAEAMRARTAEHRLLEEDTAEADGDESPVVQAARDVKGVSASSGDTALEPLLDTRGAAPSRVAIHHRHRGCSRCVLLLQILHHNRAEPGAQSDVRPAGEYGVRMVRRDTYAALGSDRVSGETTRRRSRRQ